MAQEDKPNGKQNRTERKEAEEHEVIAAGDEARELVKAVEAGAAAVARSAAAPLTADAATIREANITDEAKEVGPMFGDFLKSVGLAVAETQEKLDETFRKTAEALSKQEINVIAVFEQNIDDDGKMTKGEMHKTPLPLINYVMPTIQEISRCEISADMKISEFSSGNGFQIQGKSTSFNAGASGSANMFGGSVSAYANFGHSQSETSGGSNYAQDSAAGAMHLEATIQPRETVSLPKPFITQKGPSLKLTLGNVTALETNAGTAEKPVMKRTGTEAEITAELTAINGSPSNNKTLEVSVNQPTVGLTTPDGTKTKDGKITIKLKRENPTEDWKPVETTLRVWLGLVSQSLVLAL